MDAHVAEALAAVVRTTCPYCGVGCGVIARPDGPAGAAIEGDPEHPSNFGRLCSKGSALGETLGLDGRLLHPMIDGRRASWDAALAVAAEGFTRIAAEHGPDAVAFYLSGQLLTEDYYVANKLMKGFIGSANVDTNSRLCMASSVAGHRRAFGADTVPGCYEDLDEADLLVLVGSNAAWCHPVLYQRMLANKQKRGARMIVIDPRRTDTVGEDDLFLGLKPGTDKVNAILNCHLAPGRIGKPGASPFSLTGQPNAMGGREVGGLANQLAAHMGFTPPDIDRVRRFWKAPRIATHEGLKAVQMFEAIARGEIKALWVMGTNPAVSLPNADGVREALKKLDLFVVY